MKKIINLLLVLQLFVLSAGLQAAERDALLGSGDVLKVSVFEQPNLSLEVRVSESGTITFPLIGEVGVGGLSTAAAERKIASLLESGGYLRNPQVNIIVTQLQSQQVSVLGHVGRPGRYPIEGSKSLADILALAGGLNPDAGDLITVINTEDGKPSRHLIDLPQMMRSADLTDNIKIGSGDIVYVEKANKFYIYGEVQRASQYKLERDMTVLQALSTGGGLTVRGTERGVKIKRKNAQGIIEIINAKHDDLVLPDDVIYVKESWF